MMVLKLSVLFVLKRLLPVLVVALSATSCGVSDEPGLSADGPTGAATRPLNFLLITVDDVDWSSVGVYGSQVEAITPSIDQLASEGLRFTNAHVNIAVCQPVRQTLVTGRYPHNNGAPGFQPIADDVPILQETLRAAGYLNGSIGKSRHLQPIERFGWDLGPDPGNPGEGIWMHHLGNGRDIGLYGKYMSEFLSLAKETDRPFFLMLNTHDAHKPFFGNGGEEYDYPVSRVYAPEEIEVPGFLPDLPEVREERAQYFTGVRQIEQGLERQATWADIPKPDAPFDQPGEGLTGEVSVETGHHPQERGFPRTVGSQDTDLGIRVELQPDPFEDLLALRRHLPQVLHGVDELRHGPAILTQAGQGATGIGYADRWRVPAGTCRPSRT